MDGAKFNSQGVSLYSKFFQDSDLVFHSGRKTIGTSVYNVFNAMNENYFIKKEGWTNVKLAGEISHINVDLNLNPSLCYYPFFWNEEIKVYHLEKKVKLELRDKTKWMKFLMDKESRKCYSGLGLFLPERYFLQRPAKD